MEAPAPTEVVLRAVLGTLQVYSKVFDRSQEVSAVHEWVL